MDDRQQRIYPYLPHVGCSLLLMLIMVFCILPYLMVGAMETVLEKLHLNRPTATLVILGILLGGLINIPVYRIERQSEQLVRTGALYGLLGWVPVVQRLKTQTIVAVNLGGCLIPSALAVYEIFVVQRAPAQAGWALLLAAAANIAVCYLVARPVPGVGIAMPGLVSPAVCVGIAWLTLMAPQYNDVRAPVAFIAGVAGPLIGADLLHLRDFTRVSVGVISIGGAGTFDGIVLSGMLAALLA